ncbi:MAG: prepilin-type N-terminal cleavage/methylation domain-containing protein [Nitrospirota bacterium]|nr:prepilin-type N-terminal cleavage/methylation domain-containing protein [Nitrospirota bacterium]
MTRSLMKDQRGISLVEVMMVLAVMGFVLAAVYGFYVSQVKSHYIQEEVVDVQQNLRVVMAVMTKDIRMSGFLVPSGSNPINALTDGAGGSADSVTLNMTTSIHAYARMTADASGTSFTASVDPGDAGQFGVGHLVKVVKTETSASMGTCTVSAVGASSLTLNGCSASVNATKGDIIARIPVGGTAHPNTVAYQIITGGSCPSGRNCLARVSNGSTHVLAENMTANGLQFSYLLDNGTETNIPADLTQVRAIRMTLTGETAREVAKVGGADRQRQLTSVVSMRNR